MGPRYVREAKDDIRRYKLSNDAVDKCRQSGTYISHDDEYHVWETHTNANLLRDKDPLNVPDDKIKTRTPSRRSLSADRSRQNTDKRTGDKRKRSVSLDRSVSNDIDGAPDVPRKLLSSNLKYNYIS